MEVIKETFIEQELKKFDVVEANLIKLAEAGRGLKIKSIDDKEGLEVVRKARIAIKNERVRIEKKGKELRDQANKFNKAVLAKEKEYLSIITPTENDLQAEENRIIEERDRVERERQEAEQRKVHDRINQLSAFGYVIDYARAASMNDIDFAFELAEAKKQHEAEQKRIADEREQIRLEAERLAELNRQHELQMQEAARVRAEQEQKQREIELAEQRIRLEQEAVERERKQQLEHQEQMRLAEERAEKEKIAAAAKAEQDRLAAIEAERLRIEKELADKQERERLAAIEAKRQADLAPDKEKLIQLAKSIDSFELPSLSMPESGKVLSDVRGLLSKVSTYINQQVVKL